MRLAFLVLAASTVACARAQTQLDSLPPTPPPVVLAPSASDAPLAVAPEPVESVASEPALPDDDDLREALYRYQFRKNASGQQGNAKFFCLELADGDPSSALLARFASHSPPVLPASRCTSDANRGVVAKGHKGTGLVFRIDSIHRKDATHADATGGYYEAGLSASGNAFDLEKRDGHWIVTGDRMQWIS